MSNISDKPWLVPGHMYQYDIGWLVDKLLSFETELNTAIDLKTIHYADPIQWDITTQYSPNTVVVDPKTGTAYMSKVPVPAGILLTNTDYWVVIFNYQRIYDKIMSGIAFNDKDNLNASKDLLVNDLVWYRGDLYRATREISQGSTYIPGTNLTPTTIEDCLATYYGRDRVANVLNDTVNVSRDYTLNAGNIAETSGNRTVTSENYTETISGDKTVNGTNETKILSGKRTVSSNGYEETVAGNKTVSAGSLEENVSGNKSVNAESLQETLTGNKTVNAVDSTETLTGNKTVNAVDSTETLTGNKTVNAVDSTETLTGNKIIESVELVLKPENPITYQKPIDNGNGFKHITMKDADSNVYNVLVEGGFNPEAVKAFNTKLKWRMVRERFSNYYPKTDRGQAVYTAVQGGCVVGNYLYVLFPNTNSSATTNDTEIIQFDKRDGSIVKRYYAQLGHGNDICYNDATNKFYCVTNEYWDGQNWIQLKKLFILNNLFEIEKTVNTDIICYGCTWHKGKLLTINRQSPFNEVYEINVETGATTLFTTIKKPFTVFPPILQTLTSTGNMLAITVAFPNNILLVDDDGNVANTIPIKDVIGYFPITEAEFADYDKETGNFMCGGYYRDYSYDFNVFFEIGNVLGDYSENTVGRIDWYVDNSKYVPLPDGTESKPFYTVGEVSLLCAYKYKLSRPTITVMPTSSEYLYEELNKLHAIILGRDTNVSGWLVIGGNVQINSVIFTGENPNNYLVGCINGSLSMGTNKFAENKTIFLQTSNLNAGNPKPIPTGSIMARDSTVILNGPVDNDIFSSNYDNVTILAQPTSVAGLNNLPFDNKCLVNYARCWRCNNGVFNQNAKREVSIEDIAGVSRVARVRISTLDDEVMARYSDSDGKVKFDYFYLNSSKLCHCSVEINFVNKTVNESAIDVATGNSTTTPYHDYYVYFLPYYG